MLAEAEAPVLFGHVQGVHERLKDNVDGVEEQGKRDHQQLQQQVADQPSLALWVCDLEALAAEDIGFVEVLNVVLSAAYPTELVLALGADHMITSALFLLHDQAALRAVHDRPVVEAFEELLHFFVQLFLAVLLHMVLQTALHADLVFAGLALPVVRIRAKEKAVDFLLEFLIELLVDDPPSFLVFVAVVVSIDHLLLQVLNLQVRLLQQGQLLFVLVALKGILAALGTPSHVRVAVQFLLEQKAFVLDQRVGCL